MNLEPDQREPEIAADLVRRIGAGDHLAEAELVERYQRGVYVLLHLKAGSRETARDLCQDTF